MAIELTDKQRKFLTDKNFAFIGTVRKDGSPQVTPVWVDFDGTHVVFNTEQKRAKVRNLRRNPRVVISILNAENPYEYIQIEGRAVEITDQGGADHIDRMAKKYMGQDRYPWNQPGDVRLIVKVAPEKVTGQG